MAKVTFFKELKYYKKEYITLTPEWCRICPFPLKLRSTKAPRILTRVFAPSESGSNRLPRSESLGSVMEWRGVGDKLGGEGSPPISEKGAERVPEKSYP
jgi:hypothetical protein